MHPNNSAQKPNIDLTPEILKDFIEVQKQKTINETKELHLREKELELSARETEKAMDHQAQYLANRPAENRKTLTRIGWVVGLLLIAILGFLTTWICLGKEQFAYKFLQGSGYLITTILGYWLGSKNKKEDKEDPNISDAEVV
ncbi:hypothetical protein [Niastella populi]|uniref:DUF2335 domain-containing protein n=1 Tax=Niastella populi TaxID=550983 RepID=A0A1V9GCD5_9BACT|nr:hypothetical protein [Niastella populi]OQP68096.1 hypothetical protein A4R26_11465 [Niastella populi]